MTAAAAPNSVIIQRTLAAPPELVWQMWTEPEHFASWYGPMGATIPVAKMDVTIGGTRMVCMKMQTPNGEMEMWFTGVYREIIENRRLVYTESMCDEHGNILSPSAMGMPEGHPTTTEIVVELEPAGDHTKMTMTHVGIPEGSPGAMGWNMAFDKLITYVGALAC